MGGRGEGLVRRKRQTRETARGKNVSWATGRVGAGTAGGDGAQIAWNTTFARIGDGRRWFERGAGDFLDARAARLMMGSGEDTTDGPLRSLDQNRHGIFHHAACAQGQSEFDNLLCKLVSNSTLSTSGKAWWAPRDPLGATGCSQLLSRVATPRASDIR